MASRYVAELLRDNLIAAMGDRDLDAQHVEAAARLPAGTVARILAADPEAFPCPTRLRRLAEVLRTTPTELMSDDL